MAPGKDEFTEDYIEFADLVVYQRKKGYRFSLDSVLLAHFAIHEGISGNVLDVGTGAGVVSMLIARSERSVERILAVEIQKDLAALAAKNVVVNNLAERIEVLNADVREIVKDMQEKFEAIISNPPFRKVKTGRVNPDEEKRMARHEFTLDPDCLARVIFALLKPKGWFYLIYPARRFGDVSGQLNTGGLKIERVRLVHSFRDREAEFALIKGCIGGQKDTVFLPPLYIYDRVNAYSDELKGIYKGIIKK